MTDQSPKRLSAGRVMVALFLLAFALRAIWLVYAHPTPWSDFEDYREIGAALLDHHQFGFPEPAARRLPGLPALLAVMMLVSRSVTWLSLSQVVLSSALVVVVFQVARSLTNGDIRLAAAAGFATAINPTLITFSPVLASEHLFTLLIFLALMVALGSDRRSFQRALLVGLLAGAATLTRGESLFHLPLLAILMAMSGRGLRDRVVLAAVTVVVCLVFIAPWYWRNLRVLGPGAGLSTNSGLIFYYAHNAEKYGRANRRGTPLEGMSDVAAQRRGFELGLAYLRTKPTRIFSDIARGTRRLYWPNDYPVDANVRFGPRNEEDDWPQRELPGRSLFSHTVELFYMLSVFVAPLVVLAARSYPARTWLVVVGIPLMNWVCYAVVFMAGARYRFISDVVFGAVAGAVVAGLWERFRPARVLVPSPGRSK
jgi:hypothetical protein